MYLGGRAVNARILCVATEGGQGCDCSARLERSGVKDYTVAFSGIKITQRLYKIHHRNDSVDEERKVTIDASGGRAVNA